MSTTYLAHLRQRYLMGQWIHDLEEIGIMMGFRCVIYRKEKATAKTKNNEWG
jgi:hypothetical protein